MTMKKHARFSATALTGALAGLILGAFAGETPASAESLRDALALAYGTNPTLAAERARVRSQDESYIQARAQALPSLSASLSATTSDNTRSGRGAIGAVDPETGLPFGGGVPNANDSLSASLSANQNLYRGGRTRAGMDQAMANIYGAREGLRSTTQQVMLDTISAYMDVRRDMRILEIRGNNVSVLDRQLQASRDRFEVGEITRTDVSQAEARLAGARSQYAAAQASLNASRSTYERIVGQAPGTLEPEPPLPPLPANLEDAFTLAMNNNPDVIAAGYSQEAAAAQVRNAKGAMLPSASLSAGASTGAGYQGGPFEFLGKPARSEGTNMGVRVSIPIYSANTMSSQLRSARENETATRMQARNIERQVRASVSTAWTSYIAAQSQTESTQESVNANELAFEGVEAEAAVGLRTTLDVLNAEQELLNARLELVRAEREAYVAGFRLLQAVGAISPELLNLDVDVYDPAVNLSEIRGERLGIGLLE